MLMKREFKTKIGNERRQMMDTILVFRQKIVGLVVNGLNGRRIDLFSEEFAMWGSLCLAICFFAGS